MCKEKFNGLHVPDTSEADMEEVQEAFCNTSLTCADHCDDCLFYMQNLNEFKTWFNSHLKEDINEQ